MLILKTTADQMQKKVNNALRKKFDIKLAKVSQRITPEVRNLLKNAIVRQPAWQSILYGELRYHFGLPDPAARLSAILNMWSNSVNVTQSKSRIIQNILTGKLSLVAVPSDYHDVFGLPEASLITEKGSTLHWLEWLLVKGDVAIIRDYHIRIGPSQYSRTGEAIMVKKGLWGVPNQYVGYRNMNLVTQAVLEIDNDIIELIKRELK